MVIEQLSLPVVIFPKKLRNIFKEGFERLSRMDGLGAERYFTDAYESAEKEGDRRQQVNSLVAIGLSLFLQRRFEEALSKLEQASKLAPRIAEITLLKGFLLMSLDKPVEAIFCFEHASRKKKGIKGWSSLGKGGAFLMLKRREEANTHLEEALKISERVLAHKPKDISAWLLRGWSLISLRRPWEGLRSLEWAYDLSKDLIDKRNIYLTLGFNILIEVFAALKTSNLEQMEVWAAQWGYTYNQAQREGLELSLENALASFKGGLPEEELKGFSQAEKILRQMEDPEFRLEALKEAITRKWPEGLSVVEAIREERGKT